MFAEVDLSGSLQINSCTQQSVNCDGGVPSIYGVAFLDSKATKDAFTGPSSVNCGDFQALLTTNDKFKVQDSKQTTIGKPELTQIPDGTNSGPFTIKLPIYIPANCTAGSYHIGVTWGSGSWSGGMSLVGVSGNKITIFQKSKLPVIGAACPKVATFSRTTEGIQAVCAKISGRLVWASVSSKNDVSTKPVSKPTKNKTSVAAGNSCKTPGATQTTSSGKFACVLTGKSPSWVLISGNKTVSGGSNPPNSTPTENIPVSDPGDSYASQGCSTFPNAITNYIAHSDFGDPQRGSALIAAEKAAGFFMDARSANVYKYAALYNAVGLVIQYAQAFTKGGSGYINATPYDVQQAIALINSTCGSTLYLQ